METFIRGATLSAGELSIGTKHADWGWQPVFTVEQVEDLIGARVAGALRDAADHFERYDLVTIGHTDIGGNQIPVGPIDRLRDAADGVDRP